ncbi:MAG: histone family protein [Infirmifilum sp.]|jgi:histone H3/H4|uniref:histone family protein n=1 Tax=Infirmifilum TaxID=2856573 RepID=UPI0023524662
MFEIKQKDKIMPVKKKEYEIPLAPIDRILHRQGAERVSEDAVILLRNFLEKIAQEIAREAVDASKHAERKTVSEEDIKFAINRLQRIICTQLNL